MLLRLFGFPLPFVDLVIVRTAQCQQLLFVIQEFLAGKAGEGIVVLKENRLFGTDLLAKAAEDAPDHVDLEFPGGFFDVAGLRRTSGARRSNLNCCPYFLDCFDGYSNSKG